VPDRLVVHAVETADFGYGIGLVPPSRQPPKRSLSAVLRDLAAG